VVKVCLAIVGLLYRPMVVRSGAALPTPLRAALIYSGVKSEQPVSLLQRYLRAEGAPGLSRPNTPTFTRTTSSEASDRPRNAL